VANAPLQTLLADVASILAPPGTAVRISATPYRVLLGRLHGATNDLAGAAVETSYGYARCLEFGDGPVLPELQHGLEWLIAKVRRLEASLLAIGWEIAAAGMKA
jgi:hypothetical protein